MNFSAVHQFSLCMSSGDGISNSVFFIQTLLRELGYKSDIYAVDTEEVLRDRVVNQHQYESVENQLLLVHHGLGHEYGSWLESLSNQKVLVYHNISPPEYFSSEIFQSSLRLGKQQLFLWKEFMSGAISDSAFNNQDLIEAGWDPRCLETIPLLFDVECLKKHPFDQVIIDENKDKTTLLFVGTFLPHKAQDDLIKSFYYLAQLVDEPVQLILAGGDYDSRIKELKQLSSDLGLDGSVLFLGKITDEELYGWYRAADLYVSMSEHEGFGMPLIEASAFDVPVLAYDTSAVADTMGTGGILFKDKKMPEIGALMDLLLKDVSLRKKIIKAQRKNLDRFNRDLLKEKLSRFILACSERSA